MGTTKEATLQLRIAASLQNLEAISDFIADALQRLGFGEAYDVQLAVDEACTNIIQHAYDGVGDQPIDIRCSRVGDDLVVRIRDWGHPFDPHSVPAPDLDADAYDRRIGGLGIFIMRRMMDKVEYSFFAGRNNELKMTKRFPRSEAV